jgi:hypothetical protein
MTSTTARALLVSVLVGSLLAACTGDDGSDPEPSAPTSSAGAEEAAVVSPPVLAERWTSTPIADASRLLLRPGPPGAATLVLSDDSKRVVGLDAATGEVRWQWAPSSGRICDTSPGVNTAGVLGVLLDAGPGKCARVAALDTATGQLLWSRTVPGSPPYWQGLAVGVGERTVLAQMFCDEVVRYAAGTGRRLASLAPRDRKCAMESAIGQGLVAVIDDPETPDTPDDYGTGFIPPSTERVARELYDADTAGGCGARRCRTPAPGWRPWSPPTR